MKPVLISLALMLFFIVIVPVNTMAQNYDQELAAQYMSAREYDKAAILYEQLYEKYRYRSYLTNYIKCLSELKEFDKAEKFLKKEIKRNESDVSLVAELGLVYLTKGNQKDAADQFERAVKMAVVNRSQTINTANFFISNRMFEYAENLYLSAATQQKQNYDFELANLYYFQRDYQRMTNKFLDLLFDFPEHMANVQNRFQFIMAGNDENDLNEMLEISLLQRIQKSPQKTVYADLLIWQYSQTGRYREAYDQIVSLDKKTGNSGIRLIEFGQMLTENDEFDLALTSFDYVIQLSASNPNYQFAQIEYLNTLYQKVISTATRTHEEVVTLEKMLEESLRTTRTKHAFRLVYALANIKAFYLGKITEAGEFLNTIITEQKLSADEISQLKLLYGDILLLDENPWDATLVYAQVEKANANNPYGHEARLRKARLAYYTGQFEWAQAQLDILKAGTSRLIANDAFELSLFIVENSALDTSYTALEMFARADLYIYKHMEQKALLTLDSIVKAFPSHDLVDDVYYRKAGIYESLGQIQTAIEYYSKIVELYAWDILADNALYRMARLYDFSLKNKERAMEAYKKLLTDHPSSIYTVEARKRFRFLRGDRLNDE